MDTNAYCMIIFNKYYDQKAQECIYIKWLFINGRNFTAPGYKTFSRHLVIKHNSWNLNSTQIFYKEELITAASLKFYFPRYYYYYLVTYNYPTELLSSNYSSTGD